MRIRLLALVAAVAMVVVAVQVRTRIDDDGGGSERLHLVCAPEVAVVCDTVADRVRTTIEPAGVTADRLVAADGELGLDAWVVAGPWPEVVADARSRAGKRRVLTPLGPGIARSSVVFAVWPDRVAVLEKHCGGTVSWDCLVRAAQSPSWAALGGPATWGAPKLGLPDARRDGIGLVVLGSTAASLAPDDPLGEGMQSALSALAAVVPRPLPSFETVQAGGPALADTYVTIEAVARIHRMRLIYPAPVVTADVLLGIVGSRGSTLGALLDTEKVRRALTANGWRPRDDKDPALPDSGTLEALRALWAEVAP